MLINAQSLKAAGYRSYESVTDRNNPHYRGSWQKRFDDEHGKRFFISVALFYLSFLPVRPERPHAEMQSTDADGNRFDIAMHIDSDTTIEQMEAFFEKVWTTLGCRYYEKWW